MNPLQLFHKLPKIKIVATLICLVVIGLMPVGRAFGITTTPTSLRAEQQVKQVVPNEGVPNSAGFLSGRVTGLNQDEYVMLHIGFLESGDIFSLHMAPFQPLPALPLHKGKTIKRFLATNGPWQIEDLELAPGLYHLTLDSELYVSKNGSVVFVVPESGIGWRHPHLSFELVRPEDAATGLGVPLCAEAGPRMYMIPDITATPTPTPNLSKVDPDNPIPIPGWPPGTCYAGHFIPRRTPLAGMVGGVSGLPTDTNVIIDIYALPPVENEVYSHYAPIDARNGKYWPKQLTPLDKVPEIVAEWVLTGTVNAENGTWGMVDSLMAGKKYLVSAHLEGYRIEPAAYEVVVFDNKIPDIRRNVNFVVSSKLPYYATVYDATDEPPPYLQLSNWKVGRSQSDRIVGSLTTAEIPAGICRPEFEITVVYTKACARKIEQFQLANGLKTAVRRYRALDLFLTNGETLTFTDTVHTGKGRDISYIRYVPELGAHLLHAGYNEGLDFLLVDAENGDMWRIPSPPIISPDGKHFFTMHYIFRGEIELLLWKIGEDCFTPRHIVRLGLTEDSPWPNHAVWIDNSLFEIGVLIDFDRLVGTFQIDLESKNEPTATFTQSIPIDDTLILYTSTQDLSAEPIDQLWGLRAWPRISPFDRYHFEDIYGRLAYGEHFGALFLGNRPLSSPDGRYILTSGFEPRVNLSKPGNSYSLFIDLLQGTHRRILSQGMLPTWSPTGEQFAYVQGKGVFVQDINLDAKPKLRFIHKNLRGLFLKWSPDGKSIAVTTHHQGEPKTPGAYPPLTETVWLVPSQNGPAAEFATIPTAPMEHVPQELEWSPDSQYIVFQGNILGLDGTQVRLEDAGIVSAWLPNQALLLAKRQAGLQLLNPQGNAVAHIVDQGVHLLERAFSRSGSQLAYTQRNENKGVDIFVYDFEQNTNMRIGSHGTSLSYIQWSADDSYILYDDAGRESPIWAIPAKPDSTPTAVIKNGFLIEAVPLP